jgi:PAS domain S-box-containing protein
MPPDQATRRERELERERDHLLLLHEALAEVERAASVEARLRVFADAIQRLGFGRVIITLRDEELNTTALVAAGLSDAHERTLRRSPAPGAVWRRRLASIERFRIGNSYYLEGRDPWVVAEFGDGIPSALEPTDDPSWSPSDTLLVPLRGQGGAIVAILLLDDPEDRARPSPASVRTVEVFGQLVASMLEQAALVELAQARAQRLQSLHEVGSALARSLDERTILTTLASQVERVLRASAVVVCTVDDKSETTVCVYRRGDRQREPETITAALASVARESAATRRVTNAERAVAVPATVAGSLLAVIVVESAADRPFDGDEVGLLMAIAAQAASAVSNARVYADSQRQRRQTEALADVSRAVGESLPLDQVLHLVLRHATALLRADGACISLLRGDELEVIAGLGTGDQVIGLHLPLVGSMTGRAVRTATSIVGNVDTDPEAFRPALTAANAHNLAIVPLTATGGVIGALTFFSRTEPFTAHDAEVLRRFADHVSAAVVNARLTDEIGVAAREWAVAFDAIGSGMVLLDQRGRIQRANAQARRLMQVEGERELAGRELHEALFGEPGACDACVHILALRSGGVRRGVHRHHDREQLFAVTAAPHPAGGAVVTFEDVTEHRALAERYQRVVETSSDAIVITGVDRRIAFANPAAVELFGYGESLIGMPVARTLPDEQRDLVRARQDAALAGEPQRYESVVLRADGERRIVHITTAPLRELEAVNGIVASLRDVTDERRARDAVILSEARYRNLFDSASDAIYTLDVSGCFTSVNDAMLALTGWSRAELLGSDARRMIADEDVARVLAEFERTLGGAAVRYEAYCARSDHGRRLLSVTNTPLRRGSEVIGVLGVARDVTDERARAVALERSEASYSRLVESASDAIFTVDQDGRFTAVNRSFEAAVGRGRESLIGSSLTELIDTRDVPVAMRVLQETLAGERRRETMHYRAANGEVREGSVITSPVHEAGKIGGALGIMRDVTDERRLAEQMMQQEKLAAVGQLVSGVAHELNNPLAGVMAFAELLQALPSVDAEAKGAVNTIYREAQRAAKIVRHLLTFARQQPAERSETDLNAVVRDALALRQLAFRTHDIELDMALDPALPVTWADPFQLQQVLLNLIGNAEQALADRDQPRRITVRTSQREGTVVVSISDTGVGIDPDRLDRIFNPFYTTKPVGQGTGLGLSISDGIVRQHGGRIIVESVPGEGATFRMELPVVAPPQGAAEAASHPALSNLLAGRMLVMDDEPAMRAAMSGFLLSIGHAVDVASSLDEARALLGANEYDVVLLDLRMAGGGGDVLFTELQARDARHANRVVFVTGDTQSEAAQRFLSHAKRPSVSKPFQLDVLASVVAGVMS